jgi:hypothetical protein
MTGADGWIAFQRLKVPATGDTKPMRLYDPTSSGPDRNLLRAPPLAALQGKTIGILENGKLNAVEMLRELAALFETRHGCTVRQVWHKSNASAPAPEGVLAEAAAQTDFLITGLGD